MNKHVTGFLAVSALLAACSSGTATAPGSGSIACGTLVAPPPMLIPANGATGVADGNFTMVLGAQVGTSIQLVAPGGSPITLASTSLPSPAPSATPVPGGNFGSYAVGPLQSATTYTVQVYFAASGPCAAQTEAAGTFTTK